MRLLLDQGIPRSTARHLDALGIEAVHVADIGLSTATDRRILDYATADQRIIVTLDADFHALLALSGAAGPSVLRIRQEGLQGDALARLLSRVIERVQDRLSAGAMITVTAHSVRVHRLPVMRPDSTSGRD